MTTTNALTTKTLTTKTRPTKTRPTKATRCEPVAGLAIAAWAAACTPAQPPAEPSTATASESSTGTPPRADGSSPAAARCERPLIDDFEDGDARAARIDGRGGAWRTYEDEAGTSIGPEGPFRPDVGGAAHSGHAVHVHGKTAGAPMVWAGVALDLVEPLAPYDLSDASGLCFMGKGTGVVRVKLSDRNTDPAGGVCKWCYNDFGADLELGPEWKQHCLRFDGLAQQPGWGDPHPPALAEEGVFTLAWQVSSPGEPFDVWIDDVRLSCD